MPTIDEELFGAPTPPTKRVEDKQALKARRTAEREAAKREAAPERGPTIDDELFGAPPPLPALSTTITPTTSPPISQTTTPVSEPRGPGPWKEGIEPQPVEIPVQPPWAPPPEPMSRLEQAGWTAAGVGVPVVLGTVGTAAGTPLMGGTLAGLGSAGVEHLREAREKELGLRKDISPGLIAFEGITGAIPGAPLEKIGITKLAPRIAARGVEGAIMGAGGATGRAAIGEGRLPTIDEVLWGAGVGGVTGVGVGGGAEYVTHRMGGRAGAPEVVPPEKLTTAPEIVPPERITTAPSVETPAATHPVPPGGEPPPPVGPAPVGSVVEYDAPDGGRTTGRVVAHHERPDGTVAIGNDGRIIGPEHNPAVVALPPDRARMQSVDVNDVNQWTMVPDTPEDFLDRMRAGRAPLRSEAAPGFEPQRMVTRPGETIGPGGRTTEFVGPPEPRPTQAQQAQQAQGGRVEAAPPRPAGAAAAPPPGAEVPPARRPPRPEDEYGRVPTTEEAAESRPWAESPFRKVPGVGEAVTGEEVTPARPRDPERLAGEVAAIPRLFGNLSPEGQQVIEYSVRENADAIAERAGQTRPMERTRQLARDLTFDPRKAAKQPGGTIYNDVQLEAIGNHVEGLGQRIERLRKDYEADPTSELTKARLKNAYDELTLTVLAYKGGKAEVGRALNMMKARKRALDMGDARFITEANRAGISAEKISQILKATDPLDNKARFEALVQSRKPGFWKQWHSFIVQNVLSAPTSQERNVAGNTINLVKTLPTTPVAGAMDWARVAAMGGERQIYASEAFQHAAGWKNALKPAWKGFMHVMKKGYAPGAEETFDIPPVELLEGFGPRSRAAANVVLRGMRGMDFFFRHLVTEGETRALAYRNAQNQAAREQAAGHITPAQFKQRFRDLVVDFRNNPTPEMQEAARKFGERGVFQETDKIDQALMNIQKLPGGRYIMPFVRTPMNIIRQGFQMTPAGFVTKAARQGGRAGTQALAEAVTGSMGMLGLALLVDEKKLTGSGPSDPNERERLYKTGWRPNSMLINGHYVSYNILGPLAIPISLVANGYDRAAELEAAGKPQDAEDIAFTTIQRMWHTVIDQSYLKGLNDVMDALDSQSNEVQTSLDKAQRVAANIASMAVPGSSLLRSVATAMDPELKAPEGFVEAMEARLPGLSQRVPPRIRSTGEPISLKKPGGWAGQMFIPTDISPKVSDPVGEEMHRLGVPFAVPQEEKIHYKRGGKEIEETPTREETLAMRQAKGFAQQAALEKLMAQPNWANMSDTLRKTLSERNKSRATTMVQDRATRLKRNGQPITLEAIYPPYLGAPKIGWAPR